LSTLQIARGRRLSIGEAHDCGLTVPGFERHELVTWDGASPVVAVPRGASARAGRVLLGEGLYRLRRGQEVELRKGPFALRIVWISAGLAEAARGSASVNVRPLAWSIVGHAVVLGLLGMLVGRNVLPDTPPAPSPRTAWRVEAERALADGVEAAAATTAAEAEAPAAAGPSAPGVPALGPSATSSSATVVHVREIETFGKISFVRVPRKPQRERWSRE
jgi:hypothetical protein